MTRRAAMLEALHAQIAHRKPIVGAGVGTALTAKAAIAGGADFVVAYHSAPLRLSALPSITGLLPLASANELVLEIAPGILTARADGHPIVATVYAADGLRSVPTFLSHLADLGVTGILNAPTVGLIDGRYRRQLEEAGFGYEREVALISHARQLDLLACAYVFDPEQAQTMSAADADILIAHLGETGQAGHGSPETMALLEEISAAAHDVKPEVIVLCHGGPLVTPDDVAPVLAAVPSLAGYFGASSIERLPISQAVANATAGFKSIPLAAM
jgi:predicted TIM-barrel enzyme